MRALDDNPTEAILERPRMSSVIWHVTMSLDGFIAGPDDSMDSALAAGGPSAITDEVREKTGAIVRRDLRRSVVGARLRPDAPARRCA
jgi:hypothetical protein